MVFLYILKSRLYPKTYIGITGDVQERLKEHNSGHSNFTSRYIPREVIHTEEFGSKQEARVREKYYKSAAGRRKLKQYIPR